MKRKQPKVNGREPQAKPRRLTHEGRAAVASGALLILGLAVISLLMHFGPKGG